MVYEARFLKFEKWCKDNNMENFEENTFLAYFEEISKVQKVSSLWVQYSMLKAVISIRKNIDISKYKNLLAFLKRKAVGYQASPKSKLLNKNDIDTFLREADDDQYLLMKVVLIIGVAGSCRKEELAYLLVNDVKDEGNFFRIHIPSAQRDFIILGKSINGLNLIEIIRKYIRLRPQQTDQQRFFVAYRNGKCVNLPVGVNTIGIFPKRIASFLGLPDADGYAGYRIKKVPNKIGWPATAFTETFNEYF